MSIGALLNQVLTHSYALRRNLSEADRVKTYAVDTATGFGWFHLNKGVVNQPALCDVCALAKNMRWLMHSRMSIQEFGEKHPGLRRRITQMQLFISSVNPSHD